MIASYVGVRIPEREFPIVEEIPAKKAPYSFENMNGLSEAEDVRLGFEDMTGVSEKRDARYSFSQMNETNSGRNSEESYRYGHMNG